jgi:hypothetical protein
VNNKESQELIKIIKIIKELKGQIRDLKEYIKKEIVNKKKDPKVKIDWIDLNDWEEDEDLKDG